MNKDWIKTQLQIQLPYGSRLQTLCVQHKHDANGNSIYYYKVLSYTFLGNKPMATDITRQVAQALDCTLSTAKSLALSLITKDTITELTHHLSMFLYRVYDGLEVQEIA